MRNENEPEKREKEIEQFNEQFSASDNSSTFLDLKTGEVSFISMGLFHIYAMSSLRTGLKCRRFPLTFLLFRLG